MNAYANALTRGTLLALAGLCCLSAGTAARAQSSLPLLQQGDLVYEGAFNVPSGNSDQTTFAWGGTALAYNPNNDTLFMTGHAHHQRTAEISIPNIVNTTNRANLATATFVQQFADTTEGRRSSVNTDSNDEHIGGHLVYNGKLYVSVFSYYDAGGTQSTSHFVRPLSLSTTGQVQGPFRVGNDPHFASGYMTMIPPEWQTALGGPAFVGNCCLSITGVQSNGPSVSVFDPAKVGVTQPAPATMVLGYPYPLILGPGETTGNPYFNLTTKIKGVVFPTGTRSVLFFGRHGTGPYCYGEAAECGDPVGLYKGGHAYPYKYQVWAYDANDLVAVKNGSREPHELLPYDVWNFNLPFEIDNDHNLGGAAYDPDTGRIFVSQMTHSGGEYPIIHVFRVAVGARPAPPTALTVQ